VIGLDPRGRHLLAYDVLAVAAAIVAAIALRFDATDLAARLREYLPAAAAPLLVRPLVGTAFGLYRREWKYASIREMFAITAAIVVGTTVTAFLVLMLALFEFPGTAGFPRSFFVLEGLVSLLLVGGGRFALRASMERAARSGGRHTRHAASLVFGAGETGATVTRLADRDPRGTISIVGFLDDDPRKRGSSLAGRRILGGLEVLEEAVAKTGAVQLIVAIPSATGATIRSIHGAGRRLGLEVRTVPHPRRLLDGTEGLESIRRVSLDDLLRRQPVPIDVERVKRYLSGARVLITGAGGSIGSELAHQIFMLAPEQLTLLDYHEEALWSVDRDLREIALAGPRTVVHTILADVRSEAALEAAFAAARPDVVFHAAALKHVPIVELHPSEGVLTNVVGTRNTLMTCERHGCRNFVLISTDKAVEPVSVLGASKWLAELMTVEAAHRLQRNYSVVRFGNVLGSSGSVVPTFQRDLERGLPLRITDPDATRYFMTVEEAVSLILEAGGAAREGDVLVLDMGDPIRITDLAQNLLTLSGIDPTDVQIEFVGLRPGERAHERLMSDDEAVEQTSSPGVLRAVRLGPAGPDNIDELVGHLQVIAEARDDRGVLDLLRQAGLLRPAAIPVGTPAAAAT